MDGEDTAQQWGQGLGVSALDNRGWRESQDLNRLVSGAQRPISAGYGGVPAVGASLKEDSVLCGCVGVVSEDDRGEEGEGGVPGDEDVTAMMRELY